MCMVLRERGDLLGTCRPAPIPLQIPRTRGANTKGQRCILPASHFFKTFPRLSYPCRAWPPLSDRPPGLNKNPSKSAIFFSSPPSSSSAISYHFLPAHLFSPLSHSLSSSDCPSSYLLFVFSCSLLYFLPLLTHTQTATMSTPNGVSKSGTFLFTVSKIPPLKHQFQLARSY
jgi:hypothetical protein